MTADPIVVLAWLALAHLLADFVLQTNRVATEKFGEGRRAWQALAVHTVVVAVCLVPVVAAFGGPGLAFAVVVTVAHAVIDRAKIVWTMRVERRAMAEALALHEGPTPPASLGSAWTPMPAFLFALDQFAHVVVMLAAWAFLLASAPVNAPFSSAVGTVLGSADPTTAHHVILTAVVFADLAIVNVRAGMLFVATLVHPREPAGGEDLPTEPASVPVGPDAAGGPVVLGAAATPLPRPRESAVASPARVGATIGILERLLIVALVLTNATAAVGFVIAAKTLARFKQLDDRQFAEYYLLGTLGSVAVALGSALVAVAALAPKVVP
jgi:hypothetical protein